MRPLAPVPDKPANAANVALVVAQGPWARFRNCGVWPRRFVFILISCTIGGSTMTFIFLQRGIWQPQ